MSYRSQSPYISKLNVKNRTYTYYKIDMPGTEQLPYSLKVLLENLVRHEDGVKITSDDIKALLNRKNFKDREISYYPTRVLMQDFTGVPAVVDLATMRQAMVNIQQDPLKINPLSAVDLVIDHSVMVDHYGNSHAFSDNVDLEFERNAERYAFLRWGQKAFNNFRVVPPGTGICHQVNLEYLAQVVWKKDSTEGETLIFPDSVVGTDSHTTMVNGLSVLGWGVGGIEAEAAMLGQPISMLIPTVVGFKLNGRLQPGVTATDLVLTVTQRLRAHGVVGKFVEFYGEGLQELSLADRATIANMAPEYGATCGFFPIDKETIRYLALTNRPQDQIDLVEAYAKAQGLWHDSHTKDPLFDENLELDMSTVEPSMAGPKRPQDRVSLTQIPESLKIFLKTETSAYPVKGEDYSLSFGDVVIAAITSCTNTSNPSVMIGAGILAKKAALLGLKTKSWVKTSLAPGSQVVTDYLVNSGLQNHLDSLGFNLVGYGCTTCIGNSGPLSANISQAIEQNDITVCAVLSGNRNFEGRISPLVKANYLASPALVVAYALLGSMKQDIISTPLGKTKQGADVYLKDIWPTAQEIQEVLQQFVTPEIFSKRYSDVFTGDSQWQNIAVPTGKTYIWDETSTYVKMPPYFKEFTADLPKLPTIQQARCLALLGDSITTDHISPAGSIKKDSPAGKYLLSHGIPVEDFNSYGARRGNHEVMMRGTFANIRLKNEMVSETGGLTQHIPSGKMCSIYDAAMVYAQDHTPLVVIAGKEYGTGSSRDWAAKGTFLLGVKAVIAESFERIHRSNLIGMGVLPFVFINGHNRKTLGLNGSEMFTIDGIDSLSKPKTELMCHIESQGQKQSIPLLCRIDTLEELEYFRNGGILPYVLRKLAFDKK